LQATRKVLRKDVQERCTDRIPGSIGGKDKILIYNSLSTIMSNFVTISARALSDTFGSTSHVYTDFKRDLVALWAEVKDEPEIKVEYSYWLNTFKRIYDKPSLDLFIDHTYLIILTKIIVYLRLGKPDKNNLIEVINGSYFAKRGITNFLEEDFSEWLIHSKITDKTLILYSVLLEKATDYDFSGIDEDIFEWLYEK